jgi:hypothetical protein
MTKIALAMFLVIEENCNIGRKESSSRSHEMQVIEEKINLLQKFCNFMFLGLISILQNVGLVRKLTIWKQHHNQETIEGVVQSFLGTSKKEKI